MSKLVKTGKEIGKEMISDARVSWKKYLILPEGLDKLEEMLKKRCTEMEGTIAQNHISDVFSRFKKEKKI
jgi:hypothetical protein